MTKKYQSFDWFYIKFKLNSSNRFINGGTDQIRTGDQGVADPRLSHLATVPRKIILI